jgi:hypothetical protein
VKNEKYTTKALPSLMEFEFTSSGPNGNIIKVIQYTPTNIPNVYNLGFGDKNNNTGDISDSVTSNNGDREKVLSTVAYTTLEFLNKYPNYSVLAIGLTPARTRLYQIGIMKNLIEIADEISILGLNNDNWIPLKKGINFDAFLASKKK